MRSGGDQPVEAQALVIGKCSVYYCTDFGCLLIPEKSQFCFMLGCMSGRIHMVCDEDMKTLMLCLGI